MHKKVLMNPKNSHLHTEHIGRIRGLNLQYKLTGFLSEFVGNQDYIISWAVKTKVSWACVADVQVEDEEELTGLGDLNPTEHAAKVSSFSCRAS